MDVPWRIPARISIDTSENIMLKWVHIIYERGRMQGLMKRNVRNDLFDHQHTGIDT